jgi:hypothetical protein
MEVSSGSSWICQVCGSYYPRLLDLVSHTRSAHPVLNMKCGIDNCDKQVNKADSWYRHVRIHHSHHYNSVDCIKQVVASATTTTGPLAGGSSITETPTIFTSRFEDTTAQLVDDIDSEPLQPALESNVHSGGQREIANMILNLKDKQTHTGCSR